MAKQKQPTYRVEFEGVGVVLENVRLVRLTRKFASDPHIFHLDQKPTGWLMLATEGFLNEDDVFHPIEIIRPADTIPERDFHPNLMVRDGCACPVSKHTSLTAFPTKEFYNVDQLSDGSFRIAYTRGMFPKDFIHRNVERITFTPEQ
uniref:Uncharacterized protein n=1 Tax=Pseudomonas phage RVTF4 TaxID=3236931 RepID=A0AB39CDK1_9VIRU